MGRVDWRGDVVNATIGEVENVLWESVGPKLGSISFFVSCRADIPKHSLLQSSSLYKRLHT